MDRFETDWNTEKGLQPILDDGLVIVETAIDELLDFKAKIKTDDDDNEITTTIRFGIRDLKRLKNYEDHEYDQFWRRGSQIIEELKKVSILLEVKTVFEKL